MLIERVSAFVEGASGERFDDLVREAFALHYAANGATRRAADAAGLSLSNFTGWRSVPLVPTLAFKTLDLAIAAPQETFESSGTTDGLPSRHGHPYPGLYRQVIDATFPPALLGGDRRPPMLSLIPSRADAPASSLAFMVDHVMSRWGGDGSQVIAGRGGIKAPKARAFLAARQRDRRPAVLLATSFSLVQLLEGLDRLKVSFRLPTGSRLFETGGYKGRSRQLSRGALESALAERLGLGAESIVREYGMTELTSHFYSAPGTSNYRAPRWVRWRILDPQTLAPAEEGQPGLLSVFDLANLGSALHVLTEDLAVSSGDSFQLVGRASGAELRGCSLLSEGLATGS